MADYTAITPAKQLTIIWVQDDPNDTTTYYPQAEIRLSATDTLLETVDLTDNGSGRYYYNWTVPFKEDDTVIDITIKIYTDSGHTTLSSNKAIENSAYVIRNSVAKVGGGFGVDVNYKKIEKMITDAVELSKVEMITEIKSIPQTDLSDLRVIHKLLIDISQAIKNKKEDFSQVLNLIEVARKDIVKKIEDKPVTKVDLSYLEDRIQENNDVLSDNNQRIDDCVANMDKNCEKISKEINDSIEKQDKKITKLGKYLNDFSKNIKIKVESDIPESLKETDEMDEEMEIEKIARNLKIIK